MKLVTFFVVGAAGARVVDSQQQVPILGQVLEDVASQVPLGKQVLEDMAPGIGVHFTTSYAVAAARYQNGTTRDLFKVEGDAPYIELMERWMRTRESWMEDCDIIASTPSSFGLGRWNCNWRKTLRGVRSLLGLPSSRDAATLSTFLHTLQTKLGEQLGRPVASIAPAMFPLDNTKRRDFQDALELTGLTSTSTRIDDNRIVYDDVNAAYAGLGRGLCMEWTDILNCTYEEKRIPYEDVLFLSFDNSSFAATIQTIRSAHQGWNMYGYNFNLNLGWWNLPIHEVPRARFWAEVHEMIVDTVGVLSIGPSAVVLMGEHGGDGEFKSVVEAALRSVLEIDVDVILRDNEAEHAGKLAARGAAEMAWRSQYWNRRDEERKAAAEASVEL